MDMFIVITVFLAAFVYFYPLTFRVLYANGQVKLWWLPKLCGGFAAPHRLPKAWRDGQKQAKGRETGLLRQARLRGRHAFKRMLKYVVVDKLDCRLRIGAADPFSSSMLAGLFMAALGSISGVASATLKGFPASPRLTVAPSLQNGLSGGAECIFHIRCGNIIAIICALWWAKKGRA